MSERCRDSNDVIQRDMTTATHFSGTLSTVVQTSIKSQDRDQDFISQDQLLNSRQDQEQHFAAASNDPMVCIDGLKLTKKLLTNSLTTFLS